MGIPQIEYGRAEMKISLNGVIRKRRKLEHQLRSRETIKVPATKYEYWIELLNIIEGDLRRILCKYDRRFEFSAKKYKSLTILS